MTYFVSPPEREKIPPMITDSNQVRLAKMAGRRGSNARDMVEKFPASDG
jgi:hypothetical protein